MMTNTVGSRIKHARERAGLTQAELGERLGVDQTYVSRWERDEITPRGSTRLKIANALGVRTEWLRTGEGAMDFPMRDPILQNMAASAEDVAVMRETRDNLRVDVAESFQELLTTALTLVQDVAHEKNVVLPAAKQSAVAVTLAKMASVTPELLSRETVWGLIQISLA